MGYSGFLTEAGYVFGNRKAVGDCRSTEPHCLLADKT